MKFYLNLLALFVIVQTAFAGRYNITCFYDTFSIQRGGYANFTELDLKTSLEYCTHIVYGYVGLTSDSFEIQTLHSRQHQQFAQIKKLKTQYRHIKFLLSLGGDKDLKNSEKYMKLLQTNADAHQDNLISSVRKMLLKYKFDGLDLSYQFPHTKFIKHSIVKKTLDKAKNFLTNNKLMKSFKDIKNKNKADSKKEKVIQKQKFSSLVRKFKSALRPDRLMLTLTILPNVNASEYIDIPAVIKELDYINLGTYDYSTPKRSPHDADYLAPLQASPSSKTQRPNINSEVQKFLSQHIQANKLNLGIATYGRTWKMTKELKSNIMPISASLDGPALGGELTHTPGLLSWTEVCAKLGKMSQTRNKKYGNYAYRSANVKGHEGVFVTYEDKESLEEKVEYVKSNYLGGVAIFDLTLDDFRGKCNGGKFPALKAIKFKLH